MVRALQLCPDKLARMTQTATNAMAAVRPERCSILRPARISDEAGGFTETYDPVYTNIPSRVTPQGMQPWEKIDRIGDRITSTSTFMIAMPAGTDCRPQDRIRVDTLGTSYEVIGVNGPASFEVERTAQTILIY